MHTASVLRTEGLTRNVNGRTIVADATLHVDAGEVLVLTGRSGSGKSSLLRLLNRLDEPDSGKVWLEGIDTRTIAPREVRRRLGMIMQRAFLFPTTVAGNVRFGPQQHGVKMTASEVDELLNRVGLAGFGDRDVANLSGGEAQRVSIARALANNPVALLADEPTASLDEELKRQVESVLLDVVRERRLACILVTHDLEQARRIGDRVIQVEAGRLLPASTAVEE